MCPAAVNLKHKMKSLINTSAPVAARLNSVAPGANLNPHDVHAIMHLCPFETVAKERLSLFYSMFFEEDVEIYQYVGDLEKFYNRGCACTVPSPLTCSSSRCSSGMGAPWDLFKASGTSTNSLGVSQIPLHMTVCKPTRPYFPHPKSSHWIGRCTLTSHMTT